MEELKFGKYPQDPDIYEDGQNKNIVNGSLVKEQPIEWLVLAQKDNRLLLLSKYVLDYRKFNDWDTFDIYWNNCALNTWLNTDFLKCYFTPEEKSRIIIQHETGKKVFCLSMKEVLQYLPSTQSRQCQPTKWAVSQLPDAFRRSQVNSCNWWLRTPSSEAERYTMVINKRGTCDKHGYMNNMNGVGVRPALWIRK